MQLTADCLSWEAFTQYLGQATQIQSFEDMDRTKAEMALFARKVLSDPRRVASIQQNCPRRLAEMQAAVQGAAMARQIPDPAHSQAELEIWLTTLADETLAEISQAVKAEVAKRKKGAKKGKSR